MGIRNLVCDLGKCYYWLIQLYCPPPNQDFRRKLSVFFSLVGKYYCLFGLPCKVANETIYKIWWLQIKTLISFLKNFWQCCLMYFCMATISWRNVVIAQTPSFECSYAYLLHGSCYLFTLPSHLEVLEVCFLF